MDMHISIALLLHDCASNAGGALSVFPSHPNLATLQP